jgi:hypothetical protein
MSGPTARTIVVVVWLTVVGATSVRLPELPHPQVVVATLLYAPVAVVALTGARPPGRVGTSLVVALPVLAALTTLPQLSAVPLSAIGVVQSSSYLTSALAVRGRERGAVVGFCLPAAVLVGWGVQAGRLGEVAVALPLPLAALVVTFSWRRMLVRDAVEVDEQVGAQARLAVRTDAARLASDRAVRRLGEVADLARPSLAALAAGAPVDGATRADLVVVEAAVRDRVRAPRLTADPLRSACAAARRRGVRVVLLDDGDVDGPGLPDETLQVMAERTAAAVAGSVTIRVLPPGRGASATVLVDDGTVAVRHELTVPDGAQPAGW